MKNLNILKHYKKLLFFAFKRFKGNNYSLMRNYFAEILILDLKNYLNLSNKKIIDVGGSTGEISKYIGEKFDCDIVNLEPHPENNVWETVKGSANAIPYEDNYFDLVLFRNVFFKMKFEENSLEEAMLFKITYRKMYKMIKNAGFKLINTKDTHFRLHFLTKVPIFREFTIPAIAFIVKK